MLSIGKPDEVGVQDKEGTRRSVDLERAVPRASNSQTGTFFFFWNSLEEEIRIYNLVSCISSHSD